MVLLHNKSVILTYHRVPTNLMAVKFHDVPFDQFKKQMEFLEQRYISAIAPRIFITFDDGSDDHASAGSLLHELGIRGIFFIITGRLNQSGYLTRQQVVQLTNQGHLIGSHGVSHCHFTRLSSFELANELTSSKLLLEDLVGGTVEWIAPPGGVYNRAVLGRALSLGYRIFRTMDWGYASLPIGGRVDCLPVFRHYSLSTFERILNGDAPLWRNRLKNILKIIIGIKMYTSMRDHLMN